MITIDPIRYLVVPGRPKDPINPIAMFPCADLGEAIEFAWAWNGNTGNACTVWRYRIVRDADDLSSGLANGPYHVLREVAAEVRGQTVCRRFNDCGFKGPAGECSMLCPSKEAGICQGAPR